MSETANFRNAMRRRRLGVYKPLDNIPREGMVRHALQYARDGYRVFPVSREKKPLFKFWQIKACRHEKQILQWWRKWPDANIALLTGRGNELVVVDVDDPDDPIIDDLPETDCVKTSSGFHFYYYYPRKYNGKHIRRIKNSTDDDTVHIKADGGYVVAPPSVHESGHVYEWQERKGFADSPGWLLDRFVCEPLERSEHHARDPIPEGQRNGVLFSIASSLRGKGLGETAIVAALIAENNDRCDPPLDESEVRRIGQSAADYPAGSIDKRYEVIEGTESDNETGTSLMFPTKVISGFAGDFTSLYSSHLESPPEFFYWSCLTMMGLILSDFLYLDSHRREPPRFFCILLGESATTRKSTAMHETEMFFEPIISGSSCKICRGLASGEGLAKIDASRIVLLYDELKSFVSKCNVKNSSLLMATNILFERTQYENISSQNPFTIDDCRISMLGASTLDTFANLFDPRYLDLGFVNRLWLVPAHSTKCVPVPKRISDQKIEELRIEFLRLERAAGPMAMTNEAERIWHDYYQNLKERASVHTKRLDTYGQRLLPLLALNDDQKVIGAHIVDKVISIVEWQLCVRQVNDPIDAEGKVAQMEEKIRRALHESTNWSKRDLQKKVHTERHGIWVWDQAIKNLEANGELLLRRGGKEIEFTN